MIKDLFHKIEEKRKAFSERRRAKKELAEVNKIIAEAPLLTSLLNKKLPSLRSEESRWAYIKANFKDRLFLSEDGWYWYLWRDDYWLDQAKEAGAALKYPIYIAGMANPDACGDTFRIPSEIRLNGITLSVMGVAPYPYKRSSFDWTFIEKIFFNGILAEHIEIADTVVLLSGINSLPNLREVRLPDKLMWFDGFNNCPTLESVKFGSLPFKILDSYFTECPALHRIEIKSLQWIVQKQNLEITGVWTSDYLMCLKYLSLEQIIVDRKNPDSGIPLEVNILEDFSTIVFADDPSFIFPDGSIGIHHEGDWTWVDWIGEKVLHLVFPHDSHVLLEVTEEYYDYGNVIMVWQKDCREFMLKYKWENAWNTYCSRPWIKAFSIYIQEMPSLEDVTLPPDSWIYDEIEPAEDDEVLEVDKRKYVRLTPANASRYESRFGCRLLLSRD